MLPSSSSCSCILLSTFLSPDLLSKYFLVALFLCGGCACLAMLSPFLHNVQCESKKSPLRFSGIFPQRLGFSPNFTRLLHVPIYARLQIFIQLAASLTKLCHIKRDHPVHMMCSKCPPSAETHAFRYLRKSLI